MSANNGATLAEGLNYAAKVGPGLGVNGAIFLGLPLADWVYITTIVYTLLQTGYFVWKLVSKQKLIEEAEEGKNGSE